MARLAHDFKSILGTIVATLQNRIQEGKLDADAVHSATNKLAEHLYKYDTGLFPALPSDYPWAIPELAAPESLAEALLWKMGKWNIYKSFAAYYSSPSSLPKSTDSVFYAFAKHLQNPENPIYDQHALRALWAIDAKLTPDQANICYSLLVKRDGTWKLIISGSKTKAGYDLYIERITALAKDGVTLGDLDRLLMPLGQALKGNMANVSEFRNLVGFRD
jgi:hypothetical protein